MEEFVSIFHKETRKNGFMVTAAEEEKNASPMLIFLKIPTTTEKNWVDLISRPTKQEKNFLQKTYILRKKAKKLKKIYT